MCINLWRRRRLWGRRRRHRRKEQEQKTWLPQLFLHLVSLKRKKKNIPPLFSNQMRKHRSVLSLLSYWLRERISFCSFFFLFSFFFPDGLWDVATAQNIQQWLPSSFPATITTPPKRAMSTSSSATTTTATTSSSYRKPIPTTEVWTKNIIAKYIFLIFFSYSHARSLFCSLSLLFSYFFSFSFFFFCCCFSSSIVLMSWWNMHFIDLPQKLEWQQKDFYDVHLEKEEDRWSMTSQLVPQPIFILSKFYIGF